MTATTPEPSPPPPSLWRDGLLWGIVLLAATLRFTGLSLLPSGFHGDEGVAGLEAERIGREGWIGPYSPLALGQPTGPLYLVALMFRVGGATLWAVRGTSALIGTLTVAALYIFVRRYEGGCPRRAWAVALVSAALLATLNWHLHFSRIGFPLILWPLWVLVALSFLLEASRRERALWWAIAGFVAGLGFYSYNAFVLSWLTLFCWACVSLCRQHHIA